MSTTINDLRDQIINRVKEAILSELRGRKGIISDIEYDLVQEIGLAYAVAVVDAILEVTNEQG